MVEWLLHVLNVTVQAVSFDNSLLRALLGALGKMLKMEPSVLRYQIKTAARSLMVGRLARKSQLWKRD